MLSIRVYRKSGDTYETRDPFVGLRNQDTGQDPEPVRPLRCTQDPEPLNWDQGSAILIWSSWLSRAQAPKPQNFQVWLGTRGTWSRKWDINEQFTTLKV